MLEITAIFVLLCICGVQFIVIRVQQRRLRNLEKHCDSWKLAAEHWEKKANGW